ncbi:4'-phosphopantetheinyl transferase family protein [Streptomyces sp. NPDC056405]|uniref:4'-phosphopantetheinyl transferase family protein n=1 Tax=Streptomyces sp. NPDC056405 TaxID=3345811 RepID=UPI0035DB0FEC
MGRAHCEDGARGAVPDEDDWRTVLSPAELRRADSFRHAADRREFQYARWLLRTELSRLVPVAARDWEFVLSRHGKPALHPRFGLDLQFSLSHSGGVCLVVLARGRPVGADLQSCAGRDDPARVGRLVAKCLAPEERAEVERLPGRRRRDALIQLWTLKEAYAKAVGLGLRLPFNQIAFHRDDRGRMALRPTAYVPDPGRWSCHAPPAPAGFRIGVCVARTGREPPDFAPHARTAVQTGMSND